MQLPHHNQSHHPINSGSGSRRALRFWILWVGVIVDLFIVAPQSWAQGSLSQGQIWALSLLALTAFALSLYLFVVIFQPERF